MKRRDLQVEIAKKHRQWINNSISLYQIANFTREDAVEDIIAECDAAAIWIKIASE